MNAIRRFRPQRLFGSHGFVAFAPDTALLSKVRQGLELAGRSAGHRRQIQDWSPLDAQPENKRAHIPYAQVPTVFCDSPIRTSISGSISMDLEKAGIRSIGMRIKPYSCVYADHH